MSKHCFIGVIACLFIGIAPLASGAVPDPDGDLIPIKRVEPKFPREAILKMISGRVRVGGTVGTDGTVTEVHVIESIPPGVFDESALRAVKGWRFKPRVVDGVAVARPFEQTINYDIDGGLPRDRLAEFAGRDRDQAIALHARMRAMCPDRYPHADDAANLALRAKAPAYPRDALTTVEPGRQAEADAASIRELQPCLFTSWEQLRDAEAYSLCGILASADEDVKLAAEYAAVFRGMADGLRGMPSTAPVDAEKLLFVRTRLFNRLVPAYYELINAQAAQFPPATPTNLATTDALDRAKYLMDLLKPKEARSVLVKALKKETEPVNRGLLLLSLARKQSVLGKNEDALESLDQVTGLATLPWNLKVSAEMARATLCGRIGDAACFEASLTKLNAELGYAEKFAF